MDPFAALELPPGASAQEIATAYRRLAKRWHPDRRGGAAAAARMAEINVAYDMLRAGAWQRDGAPGVPPGGAATGAVTRVAQPRPLAGAWLEEPIRRALGRELLVALDEGEAVSLVTPAATWASPRTLLAVTDRRLLWLLDDAPTHRVRSLPYSAIAEIDHRARRPSCGPAVRRPAAAGGARDGRSPRSPCRRATGPGASARRRAATAAGGR